MKEITNADVIQGWGNASREAVESHGDEGDFARQHLLNPAIFALLGDIQGQRILDAGCGQGYLSRLLARKGGLVTGVEPAENWYNYALERERSEPLGISFLQEDLSNLQGFPDTFDSVVANMVFMDIPDYQSAIHNCVTSLKRGGNLIFSITHPCFEEEAAEWLRKGYVEVRDYFQERSIPQANYSNWFHRPLSAYLNLVISEGCMLQKFVEPQLPPQPDKVHERNTFVPQFLLVHATRL